MPVLIREVVTEIVLGGGRSDAGLEPDQAPVVDTDEVVRRATERVLEILRREWDR